MDEETKEGQWQEAPSDVPLAPFLPARYRFVDRIGSGGGGEILRVFDRVLERTVAFKRMHLHAALDAERIRRFAREARVTGGVQHPGVVAVHDLGEDAAGAWFTMREIQGRTLAEAIRSGVDRERLLDAFMSVCDAVAAAHAVGLVHRDLKPANIVLGDFGEVVVLDWGLAEHVEVSVGPGQGTAGYMSPEQVAGGVCARTSDVYSLGVMLGDVLGGGTFARTRNFEEIPSVEARAVARRCIDPLPDQRYPDALALGADVRRWRDGLRVHAMSYSLGSDLRRLWRRHRPAVIVALGVLLLVMAAAAEAIRERQNALDSLASSLAERSTGAVATGNLVDAGLFGAGALAIEESPEARGAVLAALSAGLPRLAWERRRSLSQVLDGGPEAAGAELPAWRVGLNRACTAIDLSPDGSEAACGTGNGVLLFGAGAGERRLAQGYVGAVAYSPDGLRLAVGLVQPTGEVLDLRVVDGAEVRRFAGHDRSTWEVSWLPGGDLLTTGGDKYLRRWPAGPEITAADSIGDHAVSPDATRAFLARGRLVSLRTGELTLLPEPVSNARAVWAPDGARLAAIGDNGDATVRLYSDSGAALTHAAEHDAVIRDLAFAGKDLLLTASEDATVGLWNSQTLGAPARLHAHGGGIDTIRVREDRMLTASRDLRVRAWDFAPPLIWGAISHPRGVYSVATVDGVLAVAAGTAGVDLYDPVTLEGRGVLAADDAVAVVRAGEQLVASGIRGGLITSGGQRTDPRRDAYLADFSADGDHVLLLEYGDYTANPAWAAVRVVNAATLEELARFSVDARTRALDASAGRVLVGGPSSPWRVVESETGTLLQEIASDEHSWTAGALGPDSIALGAGDGVLRVGTQQVVAHDGAVRAIVWSPDAHLLATAGQDRTLRMWRAADLRELARLAVPPAEPRALQFSVDGDALFAIWADGVLRRISLTSLATPAAELSARFCGWWGMHLVGALVVPADGWMGGRCS